MNLEKVFNFIKEKRGYDVPLKFKLINGMPLSEDELNVGGSLYLSHTNIESLPDNLHVGRDLYLSNTNIKSLPNNLQVGGFLDLGNTPLSKMYSGYQIRKMIEDKGGFVKGYIYR